ncbi:MAG: hypothetical protein AAGJ83_07730, partial [Planctomycetota bacterium]
AFAVLLLLQGHAAVADLVVSYSLTQNANSGPEIAPTLIGQNVSGLNLTIGQGLSLASTINIYGGSGWTNPGETDFISFGFEVDPGFMVSLERMQFRIFVDPPNDLNSTSGPREFALFYNGDGFADAIESFDLSTGGNVQSFSPQLDSLPDLRGRVEFRLMATTNLGFDGEITDESSLAGIGDFIQGRTPTAFRIDGAITAIPEPATCLFLTMALGAPLLRRQRKHA